MSPLRASLETMLRWKGQLLLRIMTTIIRLGKRQFLVRSMLLIISVLSHCPHSLVGLVAAAITYALSV